MKLYILPRRRQYFANVKWKIFDHQAMIAEFWLWWVLVWLRMFRLLHSPHLVAAGLTVGMRHTCICWCHHDDVIKWKHLPRYWPFVRGIHRSPVNSPHKGLWRGALMFSLICAWTNSGANNGDAGDLRHHHAHYDVVAMIPCGIGLSEYRLGDAYRFRGCCVSCNTL